MPPKSSPSDLTDTEWARGAALIPPATPGGRARGVAMRAVLNGSFSVARAGSSWRAMPHDLPYVGVCSWSHRRFQEDGTWEAINDALRKDLRVCAGHAPEPSVASIDSQSVTCPVPAGKTTATGGGSAATTPARR